MPPRLYKVAERVAQRHEARFRDAFLAAIRVWVSAIDRDGLASALAGHSQGLIEGELFRGGLGNLDEQIERAFLETLRSSGTASGKVIGDALGVSFQFERRDLNMIVAARTMTSEMVVGITETTREALRVITSAGAFGGMPVADQAEIIAELVGLPPQWVEAPGNLAQEIRDGHIGAISRRRLDRSDIREIKRRVKAGTVTEDFVRKMRGRYTESLRYRRALNIANTESKRAAHTGQRVSWAQARDEGALPIDTRRQAVVTPDDRLRETHAAIPGMNPGGVALGEPYETPWGRRNGPPWEPNCRCGEALIFPGRGGML